MSTLATVPATAPAADRLAALEQVIERGLSTFVDVGRALAEIRDRKLYRATHPSFKAYIAERWRFSDQRAYATIYASACADAIAQSGAKLPGGTSQDSLRVLVPLLHAEGPEAVGRAWREVQARHGEARRPPTSGEVRRVLQGSGFITSAPPKPKANRLEPIADRLRTAIRRVEGISEQLDGRLVPPTTRERVAELAALARQLADLLDGLTDASQAAARLRALEPEVQPEADDGLSDLCLNHGLHRDKRGVCTSCRRPDRPRPGYGSLNGQAA